MEKKGLSRDLTWSQEYETKTKRVTIEIFPDTSVYVNEATKYSSVAHFLLAKIVNQQFLRSLWHNNDEKLNSQLEETKIIIFETS